MTTRSPREDLRTLRVDDTAVLWIIAPLWYLACEAVAASAFPGYSYAKNYISDLGVPERGVLDGRILDSPLHSVMNAGFIGEGILFLLGLILLLPHLRRRASVTVVTILGSLHAAGITIVGIVPGSETNVDNGLILWHGLGAVLAIACGNLVAIIAGHALGAPRTLTRFGHVLGTLGFLSAALLVIHFGLPDGVWERGAVYTFIAWQLMMGAYLLVSKPNSSETFR